MSPTFLSRNLSRLAAPLAVTIAVLLLRIPDVPQDGFVSMAILLVAMGGAARFGGLAAGLITTAIMTCVCIFVFLITSDPTPIHYSRVALVMVGGILLSVYTESFDHARRRGQASAELQRSAKALEFSESRLRSILEHAPVAISLEDSEGRYILANRAFTALHGLQVDAICGKTRDDLKIASDIQPLETVTDTVRVSGGVMECEKVHHAIDGDHTLLALSFLVPKMNGAPDLCTLQTDISLRRRAEHSLELLAQAGEVLGGSLDYETTLGCVAQLVVSSLADFCMVDVIDEKGGTQRLAMATSGPQLDAVLDQLARRYPPGQSANSPSHQVLHEGISLERTELDLGISSLWVVPLRARRRVIGVMWLGSCERNLSRSFLTPSLIEELARRSAVAVDNAWLYRKARDALRNRDHVLADLREALATAAESARVKNQFLASLSHELRTPLTPVLISLNALLEDETTPAEIRESLEVARRNVALEARLIDDLLDVTRITQGKLQLNVSCCDARDLIQQAIAICRKDIEDKHLVFHEEFLATTACIMVDSTRFQQILWNLLKNATKFTPDGGLVGLRSWTEDKYLYVEVSDTGIGIGSEDLTKVFEAFQQVDSRVTRQFGGLGLGLAISHSLAEALGGRLTALSPGVGLGATFRLTIPIALSPPTAPESVPTIDPAENRTGIKILLVEDNDDTRRVISRLLERKGYIVVSHGTMCSAIEAIRTTAFDVLVSDIGLPDGSGLELIRQIRKTHPVKAIAVSGFGMEADLKESLEAGFHAHLTKPIDFAKLESTIRWVASRP